MARWKWRRQDPIGPYFADFACREAKLVLEIDGIQHHDAEGVEYDQERSAYMAAKGWRMIRFSNRQILMETERVLGAILDELDPHPGPLPDRERGRRPETPGPLGNAGTANSGQEDIPHVDG